MSNRFLFTIVLICLTINNGHTNAKATSIAQYDNQGTAAATVLLSPSIPWEEFIMPAPTIITLLGQLMIISDKVDFSLERKAPKTGFKYLRHPESFRASLVQVSNDGWIAFLMAHKNMDKIQLYMQQVPQQVKKAVNIISKPYPEAIERFLPVHLRSIDEMGSKCVALAAETEQKFIEIILLLGELLEATESSKGAHEIDIAEVKDELKISYLRKQFLHDIGDALHDRQKKLDDELQRYKDAYDKAVTEIPTGFKAVGFHFLCNLHEIAKFGLAFAIGGPAGGVAAAGADALSQLFAGGSASGTGATFAQALPNFEYSSILALANQFFNLVGRVKEQVMNFFSNKSMGSPKEIVGEIAVFLKTFENMLKNGSETRNHKLKSDVMRLLDDGKQIVNMLKDIFADMSDKMDEKQKADLQRGLDRLEEKLKPVVAEGAKATQGMTTVVDVNEHGQKSSFGCGGGNERFKAQLQLQALQNAEDRYEHHFVEIVKFNEEMKNLVGRMAKLDLQEIRFREILDLLRQGIKILAKVKGQWGKLVTFFSAISARAEVTLTTTLGPFVSYARDMEKMLLEGQLNEEKKATFQSLLQDQAMDINKIAHFLYALSNTYVDVSTGYVVDRLASLAGMLGTDNKTEQQQLLASLQKDSENAQDAIKRLAQLRRAEYEQMVGARKMEVQTYIDKLDSFQTHSEMLRFDVIPVQNSGAQAKMWVLFSVIMYCIFIFLQ